MRAYGSSNDSRSLFRNTSEEITEEISRVAAKTMEKIQREDDDSQFPVYQATNGNVGCSRRSNRETSAAIRTPNVFFFFEIVALRRQNGQERGGGERGGKVHWGKWRALVWRRGVRRVHIYSRSAPFNRARRLLYL